MHQSTKKVNEDAAAAEVGCSQVRAGVLNSAQHKDKLGGKNDIGNYNRERKVRVGRD
jgi:hypothetical protein